MILARWSNRQLSFYLKLGLKFKNLCRKEFHQKQQTATLSKKRLQYRCFPVNFAKFLRKLFLQKTPGQLLLFHHNPFHITGLFLYPWVFLFSEDMERDHQLNWEISQIVAIKKTSRWKNINIKKTSTIILTVKFTEIKNKILKSTSLNIVYQIHELILLKLFIKNVERPTY